MTQAPRRVKCEPQLISFISEAGRCSRTRLWEQGSILTRAHGLKVVASAGLVAASIHQSSLLVFWSATSGLVSLFI